MKLNRMAVISGVGWCWLIAAPAVAQNAAAAPSPRPAPLAASISTHPEWPAAKNPADVDTVEHLVAALYDVISGPAGQPRDWQRFRSLFLPDARMGVIRHDAPATATRPAVVSDMLWLTPNVYIERDDPFFTTQGFFERAITSRTEEFGNLTHVWSSYESRHGASDEKPFARGVNSLQIVRAQGRLWIASIIWDDERPGLVLPDKYLK